MLLSSLVTYEEDGRVVVACSLSVQSSLGKAGSEGWERERGDGVWSGDCERDTGEGVSG